MRSTCLLGLVLGGLVFATGGILVAAEGDELRERIQALRKEAAALAEKGHKDEAARVEKEAARLVQAAEQRDAKVKKISEAGEKTGVHKEVGQLKERLQDLRAQEKKLHAAKAPEKELDQLCETITRMERELHARQGSEPVKKQPAELAAGAEKLEAAMRRIHHLRVAAENLKLAEAHDLAHQISKAAEAMEREVNEARERLAAEARGKAGADQVPDVVRELRGEVERLRAEVNELRQQRDKR